MSAPEPFDLVMSIRRVREEVAPQPALALAEALAEALAATRAGDHAGLARHLAVAADELARLERQTGIRRSSPVPRF